MPTFAAEDFARRKTMVQPAAPELYALLSKLDRVLCSRGGQPLSDIEAWELSLQVCHQTLSLFYELLSLLPANDSVVASLADLISRLDVEPSRERDRQGLLRQLNAQRGRGLVDRRCEEWVSCLLLLSVWMSHLERARQRVATAAGLSRPRNGPVERGVFRWRHKDFSVPRLRWRLVQVLWQKPLVAEEDVAKAVYGHETLAGGALRQLELQANRWFKEKRLPFRISRPKYNHLALNPRRRSR